MSDYQIIMLLTTISFTIVVLLIDSTLEKEKVSIKIRSFVGKSIILLGISISVMIYLTSIF